MNIAVLTAFHGRPEISKIYLRGIESAARTLRFEGINLIPFYVCSPDDPQPVKPSLVYPNLPVSNKHNALGRFICDYADEQGIPFDYVIQFGSDDVFSPELFDLYRPAFGDPIIGLKDMVFHDISTGRTKRIHRTQLGNAFGAGRMIRWDIFAKHHGAIWPAGKNSGLDYRSYEILRERETKFNQPHIPVVVDLKSAENIWKFDTLKGTEMEAPEWVKELLTD